MKKNSNQLLLNFVLCFLGFSIPMGIFLIIVSMSLVKGIVLGVIAGLLFAGVLTAFIVCVAAGKGKLKERYGICVGDAPEQEEPVMDEITSMQISFLDVLALQSQCVPLSAA